ncbi:hypothetical protein [Paenibacillus lacisoli]|uniref:hypothetical protein n=1 Tax=Paenibacillus lacisoli TaxID=3064525 RepID=UPI00272D5884|nr:hypothetical protein [Paenibacillus sp. JX-17]
MGKIKSHEQAQSPIRLNWGTKRLIRGEEERPRKHERDGGEAMSVDTLIQLLVLIVMLIGLGSRSGRS